MRKYLVALLLLIPGAFLVACQFSQSKIVVDENSFDFGDVVNGEIATHDFVVRNEGDASLIVESVITTCGCTTATLEPMTILAGESGILHVAFDSGAHGPALKGEIIRQVFLASNDPTMPEVVVEISATVLARPSD